MTLKAGDKIRFLVDQAHQAPVRKGEIGTVTQVHVDDTFWYDRLDGTHWIAFKSCEGETWERVTEEGPAYVVTDKGRAMLEKFANAQPGQVIQLTPEEASELRVTQEWKSERLGTGDLASSERGSGARFNAGKPPLELIPAEILAEWSWSNDEPGFVESFDAETAEDILDSLGMWQRREVDATYLLAHFNSAELREAAYVLDFGRRKYAEWNWAKGMKWSIPVGCILRHALAILDGETTDPDSGRSHMGHIVCNVIMLVHFERYYPEGDDRPPVEIFSVPEQTRD